MAEEVGVHWAVTSSAAETYRRDMEAAKRLQGSIDRLSKTIDGGSESSKRQAKAVLTAAESLRRERQVAEASVKITKEWGVSHRVASQVARKFKGDVNSLTDEVRREAVALDRAQKETRELARAQTAASKTGGSHLLTVRNLHQAYLALAAAVGVGVLARGIYRSVEAFEAQEQVTAQVEARLRSTGNVVGLTAREIADFAREWQRTTGIADEETEKLASQLITFRGVARSVFFDGIKVAQDMATVWGKDVQESALQVFKALDDPIRGMTALRRSGSQLSAQEEVLVKRLVEVGDAAGAQRVIIEALQKQYGGAAEAARAAGGSIAALKVELGDLSEVIGQVISKGGGRGLTEWTIDLVRSSRELLATRTDEIESMADVSKASKTLGEWYATLARAAKAVAGEESYLTRQLGEQAAKYFRAAAGAKKLSEERLKTIAVTQRLDLASQEEEGFQKRLDKAFAKVIAGMKGEEQAAKELESYIRSLDTGQDKLNAELREAAERFHKGEINADLYAKAIRKAVGAAEGLAKVELKDPFALVGLGEEEGPPIPDNVAAALQAAAAQEAADLARVRELKAEIASQDAAILAKRQEIQKLYEKGKLTLEERNEQLIENRKEIEVTNEELTAQKKLWVEIMDAAVEAANNGQAAWSKTLLFIADNLDAVIDSFFMLGDILSKAGREDLGQLATGIGQLASGDYGGGIGSIAQGFGLTGGGFSQFGGRNERNFIAEGAALGAQYGGAYGAIIGAFAGAFIKGGADDLHAGLQDLRNRADFIITQAEGELAEVGAQVEQVLEGFFNGLQDSISADLDFGAAGLSFNIREGRVRVLVNNLEVVFHTIEEAIAFAAQGVLAANADAAGIGENLRSLFENLTGPAVYGSLEDLQAAIDKARELDFEETGVTGEYIKARERALAIGRQYNMDLAATLALEDKRIAAQRRSLEAEAASVFGIEDVFGRFSNLASALTRFDAEMAADHDSRVARLEEIRAQLAAGAASGDEAIAAVGDGASALQILREGGLRASEGMGELGEGLKTLSTEFGEDAQQALAARDATLSLREEMEALEASLEGGAEAFGADEISKLWTTAVDQVAVNLAQMIDSITGQTGHVAELEEIRNRQTTFALLAQIQQAQLVRATVEGVSVAVLAMLDRLIAEGQAILEGLASGDITVPAAGAPTRGGGGGRAEERKRAQEEAARAAEDFNAQVARMTAILGGATEEELRLAEAQEDLAETGRAAGKSAEEIAAAVAMLSEIQLDAFVDDWDEAVRSLREGDLQGAVRDVAERAREDLAAAATSEASNPEAWREAAQAITDGLNAELAALGRQGLDALGSPIRALRQSFRETAREIRFMLNHLDELGLTAQQVANTVRWAVLPSLVDNIIAIGKHYSSTEEGAALAEQATRRKAEIEHALFVIEFENQVRLLEIAGAMTPAIQQMVDDARALLALPWEDFGVPETGAPGGPPGADQLAAISAQRRRERAAAAARGGAGGGPAEGETFEEFMRRLLGETGTEMERLERKFQDIFAEIAASSFTATEKAQALTAAEEELARLRQELTDRQLAGLFELAAQLETEITARQTPKAQFEASQAAFQAAAAGLDINDEESVAAFQKAAEDYLAAAQNYSGLVNSQEILYAAQEAVRSILAGFGIGTPAGAVPTGTPANFAAPDFATAGILGTPGLPQAPPSPIVVSAPGQRIDLSGMQREIAGLRAEVATFRRESASAVAGWATAKESIGIVTNYITRRGL